MVPFHSARNRQPRVPHRIFGDEIRSCLLETLVDVVAESHATDLHDTAAREIPLDKAFSSSLVARP
jgi:hypothetical protein